MAYQYTTRTLDTAPLFGRAVRFAYEAMDGLRTWNDARVTRKALSALTDRELNDLGLGRGDIDRVVAQGGRRL